ncbi:MAG: prolyl oligopeptidase family serine peptidase [Ignavibacteria bacterium]
MKDNYFGTIIEDPFRWLEEIDSPETKEWIEEQNILTNDYLSKIPFREKIRNRLTELFNYSRVSWPFKSGNNYFFLKNDGLQAQSVLYLQKGIEAEPEIFIDPNKFSDDGTIALLDMNPSNDGKYLAYSVTKSGSDWLEIYVIEIGTGKVLLDKIERVKFSGANWFKDGFFYNYYNQSDNSNKYTALNEYQTVYYHKLGTPQSEDKLIHKDEGNPLRSFWLSSSADEKFLFLNVNENGKKGSQLFFKPADLLPGNFIPITDDKFQYYTYYIQNFENEIYLFTNKNAPNGKVLKINSNDLSAQQLTVLPEDDFPISSISIACNKMIAVYMEDVIHKVSVFTLGGKFLFDVKLPGSGSTTGFSCRKNDEEVTFFTFESVVKPPEIYIYDINKNTSQIFHRSKVNFDTDDFEMKMIFYISKDKTKIPMFIAHKKGIKQNGDNPVYLYSYGGFNICMNPVFSDSRILLLENGGIFAMPCIRGGGEYGESWHEAGMLKNKQNVFDDFISAAEYLVKEKYTNPSKLAIAGGSNGGLLIGAVLNQRPELFKVAFPAVGVMDMLRFQKFSIGSAWVKEYGSSDDAEMFRYILKYSPLHNITANKPYPAILVLTSDHDDRVVPFHSYKYTATLKKFYKGDNPVLIRVETKAGHGFGKPVYKQINEQADVWSFMFFNMGLKPEY